VFDKITILAENISENECCHLVEAYNLRVDMSTKTGEIYGYRSSAFSSNTSGIAIKIDCKKKIKVKISASLHKYWRKRTHNELRNDLPFTISEAKSAFETFLFEFGLLPERVKVIYFEIGLNLKVSYDPITFIELAKFGLFPAKNGTYRRKRMFLDANYQLYRQKTTEKHNDIRKYFKIYDKGFEMDGKKRGKKRIEAIQRRLDTKNNILRIETVYKRHSEKASTFFTDANIQRLVNWFVIDWKSLNFAKKIRAEKGARKSEVERAEILVNIGAEEYRRQIDEDLKEKRITPKQHRTIREFIRDFEENGLRFKTIISPQEKEYNDLFNSELSEQKK